MTDMHPIGESDSRDQYRNDAGHSSGDIDYDEPAPFRTYSEFVDLLDHYRATFADDHIGDTLVVDGWGYSIKVADEQLEITDGIRPDVRVRKIGRPDQTPKRIVAVGEGLISSRAFTWCARRGLPLVVLNQRGELYAAAVPTLFDAPGLRRAQALAPFTPTGVEITRYLLEVRLTDQAWLAETLLDAPELAERIEGQRRWLPRCATVDELMGAEAHAGEDFWQGWTDLEVRFVGRDEQRVPVHWRMFSGRGSVLSTGGSNRHATNVPNALLNFGAKLCETEATIAVLSMGLDVGLGLAHGTRGGRPAFSLDVMETGRVVVEEAVWRLCQDRRFRKSDFWESPIGELRLRPPLTHELAQLVLPALRERIGPHVEQVASMLAGLCDSDVKVATPLTEQRRGRKARRATPVKATRSFCHGCGVALGRTRYKWCAECLPAARDAHLEQAHIAAASPEAREALARRISDRRAEQRAWVDAHPGIKSDPAVYAPIAARIRDVRYRDLVAVGFSSGYAREIRAGLKMPHVRWWRRLAVLTETADSLPDDWPVD